MKSLNTAVLRRHPWYDGAVLRRLFTIAWLLSLVLCVVTVLLWVAASRWEMFVQHETMRPSGTDWWWDNRQLWSWDGGLYFRWEADVLDPRSADEWEQKPGDPSQWSFEVQPLGTTWPPYRFPANLRPFRDGSFNTWTQTGPQHYFVAFVPYWCVLLLTLVLPGIVFVRARRIAHRRRMGLCPACGYNLRATPDRCPECGHVPQKATA